MILEGPRLQLRPVRAEDAERVLELLRDPEVPLYFNWEPPRFYWEARQYAEAFAFENARQWAFHFAVVPRDEGVMAGVADLYHIRWEAKEAEIGLWLGKDYWGRGYCAEVNALLLDLAFGELGLERVVYHVAERNLRSQRAFEKVGARREGTIRLYSSRARRDVDHIVYRILRSEWEESRRQAPGVRRQ
jgi:RimJ/RimL family protein N-acetyltransferase